MVYQDGDQVHHAELAWPEGGGIMLGSARPSDGDAWPLEPGGFGAYVVTDHPDELFARAKAAGAEVLQEVYETDYGPGTSGCGTPRGTAGLSGRIAGIRARGPSGCRSFQASGKSTAATCCVSAYSFTDVILPSRTVNTAVQRLS